ncbi:MAG: hypothetical protein AAGB16_08680 [Pseudomonadota bacterium]
MKHLISSTIAAIALTGLTPALAQHNTAQSLANCMVQNSDASDEQVLKDMMIKALQDAPTDELQAITLKMGMTMINIATVDCGMSMSDLEGPVFQGAAEIYGMQMGEKIMGEALAKIG